MDGWMDGMDETLQGVLSANFFWFTVSAASVLGLFSLFGCNVLYGFFSKLHLAPMHEHATPGTTHSLSPWDEAFHGGQNFACESAPPWSVVASCRFATLKS